MKNRIELAQYFATLGFKLGAEVGVAEGRYSEILMQTIPGLTLYGVDPYKEFGDDSHGRKQKEFDDKKDEAFQRLSKYPNYIFMYMTSLEGAECFANNSLDFVFIDANHRYEHVKEDIEVWYPKVRRGGILSGHDYYHFKSGRGGIVPAVNEFIAQTGHNLQTTEWDYTAHKDDQQPDWFIIK